VTGQGPKVSVSIGQLVIKFELWLVRDLKYLSPVSSLANILQFLGLAIIFYYFFQGFVFIFVYLPLSSAWGGGICFFLYLLLKWEFLMG
jgi:hypothetical protein